MANKVTKNHAPILLPPRDYDTIHRNRGNLIHAEERRAQNPAIVGENVDATKVNKSVAEDTNNNNKSNKKSNHSDQSSGIGSEEDNRKQSSQEREEFSSGKSPPPCAMYLPFFE